MIPFLAFSVVCKVKLEDSLLSDYVQAGFGTLLIWAYDAETTFKWNNVHKILVVRVSCNE